MDAIELVRAIYAGFEVGDPSVALAHCTDDTTIEQDPCLPWGGRHVGPDGALAFLTRLVTTVDTRLVIDAVFRAGDDVVAMAVATMSRIPSGGLRAAVECLPTHDVRTRLGEITVPTLVLVGEHDEETPLSYAEALATGIPQSRLQIIPGAGHISSLEAPEAVNTALREHLAAAVAAP